MTFLDTPYAVFFCPDYYPAGGLRDLKRLCVSLESAREWANGHCAGSRASGNYDIVYMPTLTIVENAQSDWNGSLLDFKETNNLKECVEVFV